MKTCVSTYRFRRITNAGEMSELDVIEKAAEMGFAGIEFSGLSVPDNVDLFDYVEQIKEKCEQTGIEPVNYTIGADFLKDKNGNWKESNWEDEAKRLQQEVKIAAKLGVNGMRHDATGGFPADYNGARGFANALPFLIKGCRAVTEFAAEYNIKTMVENHGFFCQDSERVEKLVNGVDHANFGILIDIGNFLCVDEKPEKAVGRLIPYVSHIHAKDFHVKSGTNLHPGDGWFETRAGNYLRGAIIGHGNVAVNQCLKLINKYNYNGFISIEFEGIEEPLQAISIGLANLKKYFKSC